MSEFDEKRKKIFIDADFMKTHFISSLIQFVTFVALVSIGVGFWYSPFAPNIYQQRIRYVNFLAAGATLMGVALIALVITMLYYSLKIKKIMKQEEKEKFREFGKKLFSDKASLSWLVFITGLSLCINAFFQ